MKFINSSESETRTVALHTITSFPLDPHFPLFQCYPAMKLGVRDCVRHYAGLLVALAETIMAGQPETSDWVVTAPPYFAIPSAANLLAWESCRILREGISLRSTIQAVDLRYIANRPNREGQQFANGREYSNVGVDERIANRRRLLTGEWAPRPDPADFHGRAVLVINDINVTGTQQHFLEQIIEAVHPASIHWLYIFQVDPSLARSNPELEYSLNNRNLTTFEEFADVVARADIDYTSRCLGRLLHYPEAMLERLFRSLDDTRRSRLHQLVMEESPFLRDEDRSRAALLQDAGVTR